MPRKPETEAIYRIPSSMSSILIGRTGAPPAPGSPTAPSRPTCPYGSPSRRGIRHAPSAYPLITYRFQRRKFFSPRVGWRAAAPPGLREQSPGPVAGCQRHRAGKAPGQPGAIFLPAPSRQRGTCTRLPCRPASRSAWVPSKRIGFPEESRERNFSRGAPGRAGTDSGNVVDEQRAGQQGQHADAPTTSLLEATTWQDEDSVGCAPNPRRGELGT